MTQEKKHGQGTHELSKLEYVLPVFVTTLECGRPDEIFRKGQKVFSTYLGMFELLRRMSVDLRL